MGGPLAKVGSSAKFGVAVFKASILDSLGGGPSAKVCFVCQVLCTGIQGISALLMGGPLAKVGSSAKFGVVVFKVFILDSLGGPSAKEGSSAKYEHTSKFTLASQVFSYILYERPNKYQLSSPITKRQTVNVIPPSTLQQFLKYPIKQDQVKVSL